MMGSNESWQSTGSVGEYDESTWSMHRKWTRNFSALSRSATAESDIWQDKTPSPPPSPDQWATKLWTDKDRPASKKLQHNADDDDDSVVSYINSNATVNTTANAIFKRRILTPPKNSVLPQISCVFFRGCFIFKNCKVSFERNFVQQFRYIITTIYYRSLVSITICCYIIIIYYYIITIQSQFS